MTERRLYIDEGVGETRGVVTLDGRPERLLIRRDGDSQIQALGARQVARVRKIERVSGLAFLELEDGPDAVLNLRPDMGRLTEGQALEIEIRTEARSGKGASAHLVGEAEGKPRLLEAAPSMEDQLQGFARGHDIMRGPHARSVADVAQDEALQTVFPLPGGGDVAIESTRALTAVDVDMGSRGGGDAKKATRAANFAALGTAARALRLKGLGGLVVIDLAGRGHDGPALLSGARQSFGPDNPGVAMGPISRFGTLELTIPRRTRPVIDLLTDGTGAPSALTEALRLIRALEREAAADGGARIEAAASEDVAAAAAPYLKILEARFGARLAIVADPGRRRGDFTVGAR